ncbi:MAG: STAS domain-containing protein [Phycisphaerales bacterium]|nr:STAS domain-containing protein [Phycisphaerales bacterium]
MTTKSSSQFASISSKNGLLTVRPAGPNLGEREAMIIANDVKPIMDSIGGAMRGLVLDLSDVAHMSSFGLGMCIELRNHAKTLNATTVIYRMSDELTELFKMMKVDRLYTIAKTAKDLAAATAA